MSEQTSRDDLVELTELKRLAEAATAGPWATRPGDGALDGRSKFETKQHVLVYAEDDCDTHPIADASCNHTCRMPEEQEDNAAFIAAANPATVLDLIAQIEHLTAEREKDRAALERIATVDMGGGFVSAGACRKIARARLEDTHD
jgi:hypothetical protein